MMKDYVEPHFDDEGTLLSARPVVPLEKIEAKVRRRRHWVLGGAFAIAMMLGAASALLASYLKLRNVPQTATELTVEPEMESAPVAVANAAPAETPVEENANLETSEETAPVPTKREPVARHRTVAPRYNPVEEPGTRAPSEVEQLEQIRDAVLYEQWQERRARRVQRRERRRAEPYNHRDLSNLDEIFEGRRRP